MEKIESKNEASNSLNNNNTNDFQNKGIPFRPTKLSEFLKAKKNANIDIDLTSLSQKTFTSLIGDSKKNIIKQKEEEAKISKNSDSQQNNGNPEIKNLKIQENERKRKYRLRTDDVKMPSNISLLKKLCEKINKNEKESAQSIFKFEEDDNNINNGDNKDSVKNKVNDEINKNKVFTHKKTNSQNFYNNKEPNNGNNTEIENINNKKQNMKKQKEMNVEYEHLTYADSIQSSTSKISNPIKQQNKYKNNNYYNKNPFMQKNNNNLFLENEIIKNNYFIRLQIMAIEFSFTENINIQFENSMEDKSKSIINFNNNPYEILLQIFDGHGGGNVSSYLQKNFSKIYQKFLNETQNNIPRSLTMSFLQIDEDIKLQPQIENQGSTGTIIHIIRDKNNRLFVYNGNVGDSRACLISAKKIIRLSQDHRTSDKEERKRIIAEGGMIINNRVNGELMLTRSFGDFDFKQNAKNNNKRNEDELRRFRRGVICEPFITQIEIDQNINNQFLFLASDGVWDVIREEEIQQLIKVNNDTEYLSSIIIEKALFKKAWDNLSIFVAKLT